MAINLRRELMEIGKSTLKKKDKGGGNRQSVEPALTKVPGKGSQTRATTTLSSWSFCNRARRANTYS